MKIDLIPGEIRLNGYSYVLVISRPDNKWFMRYSGPSMFTQTKAPKFDKMEDAAEWMIEWLREMGIDCLNIEQSGGD